MNILIVEDNLEHLRIIEYGLRRNNVPTTSFVVRDGQEVLDYLFRKPPFNDDEQYPLPDLILLDLNLPKRDGREVLKILKEDSNLKDIPIVIVSTSDREEDIRYAFQFGVAAYLSKSSGFDNFTAHLATVTKYAKLSKPQ